MTVDYSVEEEAAETASEPAPKRGPGRPPGSRNKSSSGATPKASNVVKDTARKARASASKAFIREQCAAVVAYGNLAFVMLASPAYKDDALTNPEMDSLTDALVLECSSSERIMSWLGRVAGVSPHVALISCLAKIALPRLQKHGVIPGGAMDGATSIDEFLRTATPEQWAAQSPDFREMYKAYEPATVNGNGYAPFTPTL